MNNPPLKIVLIGLGIVGEAYLNAFSKKNNATLSNITIIGIDINQKTCLECVTKYAKYNNISIYHNMLVTNKSLCKITLEDHKPQYIVEENSIIFSDVDCIMIAVNTPAQNINEYTSALNMSNLWDTLPLCAKIMSYSPRAQILLRSTVHPGTTRKYANDIFSMLTNILKVDSINRDSINRDSINRDSINRDSIISNTIFQPEFLRAISAHDDAKNPWAIVFGTENNTDISKLLLLFESELDNVKVIRLSVMEAELLKIYHNAFNACKISFFNQCNMISKQCNTGADGATVNHEKIEYAISQTCEGLLNPRYGTKGGIPFDGACLPKDTREFAYLEKKLNLPPLAQQILTINNLQPIQQSNINPPTFHMDAKDLLKSANNCINYEISYCI